MSQSRKSIQDPWGPRTPYRGEGKWPARVDLSVVEKPDRWVRSCCVLCSTGCGLDVGVKDDRIVGVRGLRTDRVNRGRLGPKGLYGWQANNSPDRLTKPLVRDGDRLREATWDEAMGLVVERCQEVIAKHTPGGVGIYNSGQLFIEEYYTLSLIAQAGIGTPHLDGNTRLCTATSSQALRETFGSDGQPCSYADLDVTDCLLLVGSNMAENQTVLWSRVLDRLGGRKPPRIVVVDPRRTPTAAAAEVHLRPRLGTNVALLNGLLHLLIAGGHADNAFIQKHTVGFELLKATVQNYPPERVRAITGVPEADLQRAAELIGTAPTLVSCVLQGVYQSNQATAAAVQVNNVNLVLGRIGMPGSGVMQMNGQPTAQNTRETGCDGEFPFFLNWQNPDHVARWASLWNVDPLKLPHWHLHSHAMEIFHHVAQGSIKFLWVIGTNPAVSMPELRKMRTTLDKSDLFLVVQDAFRTETAEFADVVLPAAIWGEKTGTFTNIDRTVHVSHQAVHPPGEAKSDLDVFIDFAQRMGFKDRSDRPLIKWKDAASAFKRWTRDTRGWFCDYSGLTYEKLSAGTGVQWPCNRKHPDGCERIYTDHKFRTAADVCETFGHDLVTGTPIDPNEYKAHDPGGRAILKAADYAPPPEEPDVEYPFFLTTGRVTYHFHTRTKTARCPELNAAAPEPFVEICAKDAERVGVVNGDAVEVESRRGTLVLPVRVADVLPGHLFIPFHYGYWDQEGDDHHRAANELTITAWDPVSKQPYFKHAAVRIQKSQGKPKPISSRKQPRERNAKQPATEGTPGVIRVADYLGLGQADQVQLATVLRALEKVHSDDAELVAGFKTLARLAEATAALLKPFADRYGEVPAPKEQERVYESLFSSPRPGPLGVLRDLHALSVVVTGVRTSTIVLVQVAKGLRDVAMIDACIRAESYATLATNWIQNQIKHRAVQTLVVPT